MGQHAGDGSSRSARRASTGAICAGIPRMGRCTPPQDSVLLSPEYDAGTPRDGSRPARRAGAAPCCVGGEKRKARGRAARCAMGGSTTRFRAVFWVLPHPCFPAYSLYIEPKSCPDRALSCIELGVTQHASRGLRRFPGEPLHPPPSPETARGRRRTPGVGAPPPPVLACTAAPVLGPGETPAPRLPSPGGKRPCA